MSSQPVEANVVLTADNSGYDQAMSASAATTQQLMQAVDSLTAKVSKMSKTAGKSLIGISAADTAMIGGATKAWNDYEKQMSRLQSQSAVLSRSNDQQNKVMKDYTNTVKTLRSEMGTTTTQAAALVETLSKVTSISQTRQLTDLAKTFTVMAGATGESSEGLASSLTNLQKVMGEPINVKTTKQYADTFTYLAAQTGSSAQGLMDFTAQLAPVAKGLGMNTKEVAGFATAFTKAGAEGGTAATAFTKVTGDMLKSIQSGSPELAHYANMVGTTQGQFKKLATDNSAEAVVEVFESLSKHSKTASQELARLGLDGPRTIRAIMSMTNQPGGIRAALGMAEDPRAKGAANRGYQATMAGLSDEFDKLQEDLKQTAEAFATYMGPALEMFLKGMEKAASIVQSITEGPMGKFVEVIAGFLAPLAGAAGLLLLFAGALVKVASAFTLLRSSSAYGLREGFKGGAALTKTGEDAQGRSIFGAMGGGALGKRGAQLAEGGTWVQRGLYNAGAFAGQGLGAFRRGGQVPESWYTAREALSEKIPWTDQYQRPTEGTMRTPLSYIAGGLGRGIQNFVTPTFDQMRYADPTKRTQWAGREAPWASMQARSDLVRSMGRVGLEETRLAGQRAETTRIHQDPLLNDEERQARLQTIRATREETRAKIAAATQQETAAREVIASQQQLVAANEEQVVGGRLLGKSLRELGTNVGGGILGAGRAGLGTMARSGMMGQAGAMGAMAIGGMTGSNALMMGGTGAMIGSMFGPGPGTAIGATAGTVLGVAMSAAKANNDVTDSIKNLDQQAADVAQSGSGIQALHDSTVQSTKDVNDYSKRMGGTGFESQMQFWLGSPKNVKDAPGAIKNAIEGIFGHSDVTEAHQALDKTTEKTKATEGAVRDLAKAGGVKLTGTKENQLKQLDAWMSDKGMAQLATGGVDLSQLVAARAYGTKSQGYQDLLQKATLPGQASGAWDRMRDTAAGRAMLDDKTARQSIRYQSDVGKFYDATNNVFDKMHKEGMSNLEIVKSAEMAQQKSGDENSREYEILMAVSQKAQTALAMQAPQLGRAATFAQQLQLGAKVEGITPKTDEQATQIENQKKATEQAVSDNDQYFRSLILAQESYERSRKRAQYDYSLQRQYEEYDYNLQRERAEENFNRMRARAIADYNRSVTRAWSDFYLQRKRQEEDYQHQIEVTAQQQATGMNLYQRTDTQRTSSATWLLANTNDILQRLRDQKKNLNKLRELGFSDQVIQQLQLTDPSNAQELSRFVAEVEQDRTLVGKFNRTARSLQSASKAIVTDPSSLTFQEMQRSYNLARKRGSEDMHRTMDRNHEDFWRGLRQQRTDYNIMLEQQAQDYENQMNRQEKAYHRTMHNAAVDMAHMADEVTGSIESVLVQAHQKLTGSAKTQAGIALKSFRDMKNSTNAEAVALMSDLAQVFGFKYDNPLKGGGASASGSDSTNATVAEQQAGSGYHNPHTPGATNQGTPYYAGGSGGPSGGVPRSEGGMVPGWSPGRDTVMVNLSGGEAIMRPEWARRVGEKNIDAMNHAAKHGGFADGGIYKPVKGYRIAQGPHDQWTGYTALDLGVPIGTPVYAVESGTISRSYDIRGVEPRRPGKQDGYKSYGRVMYLKTAHGGPTLVYAHLSKRGFDAGTHVNAGQAIGLSGDTGYAYGPHLHFGDSDGNPAEFLGGALGMGTIHGAAGATGTMRGAGMTSRQIFREVLKKLYPKSEASAAAMKGVHPLFPGMISTVINRFARQAIRGLHRTYGAPGVAPAGGGLLPSANYGGNASGVWSALTAAGFTKVQAAGIMGNMLSESGFDPFIIQGGGHSLRPSDAGGGGYGLVQWTPGSKVTPYLHGHKPSVATEINALREQLAGLGPSPEGGAGAALRGARSVAQAARAFEMNYERHAGPPQPNRTSQAQAIYAKYAADGAIVNGPQHLVVGEQGPEAVIPLNDRGADFMARSIGLTTMAGHGGHYSIHNYRIDRSTNFTGPISVQAQDPAELLAKLQARQRVRALSRPALTGSAA